MSRAALLIATATAAVTLGIAGPAAAQTADRDCPDFATQADAQAAYDAVPGDPERLDRDGDGIACEDGESGGGEAAAPVENTATANGELPFTGPRENAILAVSGSVLVAGGAALVYAGRRRTAQ